MHPARRLEELGPWDDRQAIIDLGPDGLLGAWVGSTYSVQHYGVTSRPGWDRLHVQRHDGGTVVPWADLQAIKLLLEDGADRLGFECYPRDARIADAADAYHLWVLPLGHPLEAELDLAEELSRAVPPAPWRRVA